MLRGIHTSMLRRAATWRRAVRALAGGYCAPSRATFRERGMHGNFFGEYVKKTRDFIPERPRAT